ncbi:MAG: hypothetical protein KC496_04015, partial [Anaerolineae bacterium]|nr:hypothetical protein [Anaerolineae bacterium]
MDRSQAGKKGYEKTQKQLDAHRKKKSKQARKAYESDPKTCPTCGRVLPYEKRRNKFCSQSCAATYNNKGVVRLQTVNDEFCAYCGEKKEKRQNKYCDDCIREGVYNPPRTLDEIKSERTLRKYLLR